MVKSEELESFQEFLNNNNIQFHIMVQDVQKYVKTSIFFHIIQRKMSSSSNHITKTSNRNRIKNKLWKILLILNEGHIYTLVTLSTNQITRGHTWIYLSQQKVALICLKYFSFFLDICGSVLFALNSHCPYLLFALKILIDGLFLLSRRYMHLKLFPGLILNKVYHSISYFFVCFFTLWRKVIVWNKYSIFMILFCLWPLEWFYMYRLMFLTRKPEMDEKRYKKNLHSIAEVSAKGGGGLIPPAAKQCKFLLLKKMLRMF